MNLIQKAKKENNKKKGIPEESEDESDEEPNANPKKKIKIGYDIVPIIMEDVDNLELEKVSDEDSDLQV